MSTAKPISIVCATTRQWNPGDEWIASGIRRLITRGLEGRPANWILYDRSPDCFEEPWRSPVRVPNWLGNSYWGQRDLVPDLVVSAGTPEWRGPHLKTLRDLHSDARWLFLGIGAGEGPIELDPAEAALLARSIVTARDPVTADELAGYGVPCPALPCPGLFGASFEAPPRQLRRLALVLQSDRVENQRIEPPLKHALELLAADLAAEYQVEVVCNYIDEFLEFAPRLPVAVRYHYDSSEYEAILGEHDLVVSSRLHSCLLANSLLKPAVLINPTRRARSAASLCPFVFVCNPGEARNLIASISMDSTTRGLFNWKRGVEQDYQRLLADGLGRHDIR